MVSLCGIDEAGRGPVIGPLVMAGVLIDESKLENLRNIGVKDSKLLSPLQRERLYDKIIEIVDGYEITITHADEVDKAVNSETSNLNWLEADKSIQIITKLNPENNASTSLDLWNKFEIQNPDTFRRMYKFWVQKI